MDSPLDLLRIKNALIVQQVAHVAFFPKNKFQILAIVLSNDDIVLWKTTTGNYDHIIKWIPWKNDEDSKIRGITFQPEVEDEAFCRDKIELLVITVSCTIYRLSVEKIMEERCTYQEYSQYSLYPSCTISDFSPTALIWWKSSHYRHRSVAVIGGTDGQIIFYSMTHSHCIASANTGCKSAVSSLSIYTDFLKDFVYLLVTDDLRQQWKLPLEKERHGRVHVLLTFEEHGRRDSDLALRVQKSGLQQIKQMSVETFARLKQKLHESRLNVSEELKEATAKRSSEAELQSLECYGEAYLSVQQFRNRRVLTGLFTADSVLQVYLQNKDTITSLHHKLQSSPLVNTLLLTHTFIYVADVADNLHRILVFSTRLSEYKNGEITEFNPASLVQSFVFAENEHVINLHKMEVKLPVDERYDLSYLYVNNDLLPSSQPSVLSRVKQNSLEDEWNEACLVVTNVGVYIISLKDNPLKLALACIKADINLVKTLPLVFNVPLSKIIELISDRYIEENKVDEALLLCNKFKCYSGKIALRLAFCCCFEELLLYTENVLNQLDVDLPLVEKIHLSNFVVTCYCERYLRNPSDESIKNKFLQFLKCNRHYDEEVNIHILGNYRMCEFLHFLVVFRGLYVDGAVALTNMIGNNLNERIKNLIYYEGFWQLFSEISFVNAFVRSPTSAHLHIYFLRENLKNIPKNILEKLYQLYDPMQLALRPALWRMLQTPRNEYLDAYDFKIDRWGSDANMYDWITNFIYLHIKLMEDKSFDRSLRDYFTLAFPAASDTLRESLTRMSELHKSTSPPVLCAGAAHAALIKKGSLVMWGQSAYGCLGMGPTLSQNCPPTLSSWFEDHRVRVRYVACGKNHTLALTENGVYAWGWSRFGQLGIGPVNQSAYPRLVETLSSSVIINIGAGQYHSLAVDINGRLWTWGWGVYGQLGHGDVDDQLYPKLVKNLEHKFIVHACGGQAHSVVLTKKGKLFTFGCNTYGQLGIGTTAKSTLPVKVFGIQESVTLVATQFFHNLALSTANRLYTWGSSPHLLKLQSQSQKRARTVSGAADKNGDQVLANADSTSDEELNTGDPLTPQKNENTSADATVAQVDNTKHLSPTLVDTSLVKACIKEISCGLFHSALLTTTSRVYSWGRNTDGQLGNCKRQSEILIPTLVYIIPAKFSSSTSTQQLEMHNRPLWSIACGRDYTLVVELENRLYGWGNNGCGQLGTAPQEDFSLKRFLNGKFIVNKDTKRMIRWSHGGVNAVETPVAFTNLPKFSYPYNGESCAPNRYTQIECDLELPGFSRSRHSIQTREAITSRLDGANKVLHYYLECFHRYYNPDFILETCADSENLQAMAKISVLNYRFYDAFFYELKALLVYINERFCFDSFDEISYENLSKKRLILKHTSQDVNGAESNSARRVEDFEFVEDVVREAIALFEKFCQLVLQYTPDKIGVFLNQSISAWITWHIPIQPLEESLLQRLDAIAYPLAVFLFCDRNTLKTSSNDTFPSISNRVENNAWKDKHEQCVPTRGHKKGKSVSFKIDGEPKKMSYPDLYARTSASYPESNDAKYQLSADVILRRLSTRFTLTLCNAIVDSMSRKSTADFDEFVHMLHEIVFSPSVLKSDDRTPQEVLSAVLNTLRRTKTPRRKYIQISYQELCEQPCENKLVVFSCGHYYVSESDYEKEISSTVGELNRLRLYHCSELVSRLFSANKYTTCCPNCLFRHIESGIVSK